MGADYYESEDQKVAVLAKGGVPVGIGAGSTISNAIIDKNARVGGYGSDGCGCRWPAGWVVARMARGEGGQGVGMGARDGRAARRQGRNAFSQLCSCTPSTSCVWTHPSPQPVPSTIVPPPCHDVMTTSQARTSRSSTRRAWPRPRARPRASTSAPALSSSPREASSPTGRSSKAGGRAGSWH